MPKRKPRPSRTRRCKRCGSNDEAATPVSAAACLMACRLVDGGTRRALAGSSAEAGALR